MVRPQHRPGVPRAPRPAAGRSAGSAPRGRERAPSRGLGVRIDRLVQAPTAGRSARPPPGPRPRLRAGPGAHRPLERVASQVVHQALPGAHGVTRRDAPLDDRPGRRRESPVDGARGEAPRPQRDARAPGAAWGVGQASPRQPRPPRLAFDCAHGAWHTSAAALLRIAGRIPPSGSVRRVPTRAPTSHPCC
jgi:hypothetical protein